MKITACVPFMTSMVSASRRRSPPAAPLGDTADTLTSSSKLMRNVPGLPLGLPLSTTSHTSTLTVTLLTTPASEPASVQEVEHHTRSIGERASNVHLKLQSMLAIWISGVGMYSSTKRRRWSMFHRQVLPVLRSPLIRTFTTRTRERSQHHTRTREQSIECASTSTPVESP